MKTLILTESQVKNLIDGVILEQNESKKESITVNFGAVWPMGKWKITPQQTSTITGKLVQITNFINQHKGSTVKIQIESGESKVTNKDNEVSPAIALEPGVLSQKRGESMKNFLTSYFQSLVGKAISQSDIPEIPEPKTIIGTTDYSGPNDLQNKSKVALYNQEQFVRAVITAEKNYECIVGMEITIGYYSGKNKSTHECDEAIFELRMNGISLGVVNLNNSSLDMGVDYATNRFNKQQTIYDKQVKEFERQVDAGVYKERERKKVLSEPPVIQWPQKMRYHASTLGYETIEPFIEDLKNINNSFNQYGRKSDGKSGGNRSQTFVLDGARAKSIIDNSPSNNIVLSIIPLVSKDGKYKIFYQTGTHADTPWVTIINRKLDKTLYDGEPNIGMKRGSTQETVLLTTDLCGNPLTQTAK